MENVSNAEYQIYKFSSLKNVWKLNTEYPIVIFSHNYSQIICDNIAAQDHNTSNPRERERVTAMGGAIKENRVGGVLIPTRYFIHPKFLNDWGILNVTSGVSETFY